MTLHSATLHWVNLKWATLDWVAFQGVICIAQGRRSAPPLILTEYGVARLPSLAHVEERLRLCFPTATGLHPCKSRVLSPAESMLMSTKILFSVVYFLSSWAMFHPRPQDSTACMKSATPPIQYLNRHPRVSLESPRLPRLGGSAAGCRGADSPEALDTAAGGQTVEYGGSSFSVIALATKLLSNKAARDHG